MKRVSVIGLGYVGLTFAACLADRGFEVLGVEVDKEKLKIIASGSSPFYEEGLKDILRKVIPGGYFKVTGDVSKAVKESDVTFVCVGTPSNPDGSVDLSQVEGAVKCVGRALSEKKGYHLVVIRSTVPPGTTDNLVKDVLESESGKMVGKDFGLCFNPEFFREGKAVEDTLNPDRLVIGAVDQRSAKELMEFYRDFYGDRMPSTIITNPINAELIKYANNAFLAMKISFANMFAGLCEKLPGADVKVVMEGIGLDKRIGKAFLGAGLGWGGSCLPKDTRAILTFAKNLGFDLKLVRATVEVNEEQIDHAISLAEKMLRGLEGKTVSVLGLAFKPGTDDIRESRAIKLVEKLTEKGARVKVHDPKALDNARKVLGNKVEYSTSIEECLRDSDLCILATEWPEYRKIKSRDLRKLMRSPAMLDCRRLYNPADFKEVKFMAIGLGRQNQ